MIVKELIKQLSACDQEKEVQFVPEKGNSYENVIFVYEQSDIVVIG